MENKKEIKKKMIKGYLYNAIILILFVIINLVIKYISDGKIFTDKGSIIGSIIVIITLLLVPSLNIFMINISVIAHLILLLEHSPSGRKPNPIVFGLISIFIILLAIAGIYLHISDNYHFYQYSALFE